MITHNIQEIIIEEENSAFSLFRFYLLIVYK